MTRPILYVTRPLPGAVEARAARDYQARLNTDDRPVDAATILAGAAGAAAILCTPAERFDAALIGRLPDTVRVLGTFSVGVDHIDLDALRARAIPLVNTPDVLSAATAECAMLLILMAARRALEGDRLVRSGEWRGWRPTQLLGTQVCGKRLGIFGMGRIGRELARMAQGFGMEVHYRSRHRLPSALERGAVFHAEDAPFLAASQILSLNAPGGAPTRGWLDAGRIARLPPGALVVNAARGTLVDDAALIAALRSGQVAAAGLDVYNDEPQVHPGYRALDNVVLLPHLGSATIETRLAMGALVLDGIDAVLAGRAPANRVG